MTSITLKLSIKKGMNIQLRIDIPKTTRKRD